MLLSYGMTFRVLGWMISTFMNFFPLPNIDWCCLEDNDDIAEMSEPGDMSDDGDTPEPDEMMDEDGE